MHVRHRTPFLTKGRVFMAPILIKLLTSLGVYIAEKAIGIITEVRKGPQITATIESKEEIHVRPKPDSDSDKR